jgi:hypothetical protein
MAAAGETARAAASGETARGAASGETARAAADGEKSDATAGKAAATTGKAAATGGKATPEGPAAAEAPAAARDPGAEVTIVPGIARYHRGDCILIRFLGPEDLQTMTLREAAEAGCAPCKACRPDQEAPAD